MNGSVNCGACLMDRAEVVALDVNGICPKCGADHCECEGPSDENNFDGHECMFHKGQKHTKGPWKISHSGYSHAPYVIFAGSIAPDYKKRKPLQGVQVIAEVQCDEMPHGETEFNARLLTAAPELLVFADTVRDLGASYGAGHLTSEQLAEYICALLIKSGHAAINKAING